MVNHNRRLGVAYSQDSQLLLGSGMRHFAFYHLAKEDD
jgi:hypothetical protein